MKFEVKQIIPALISLVIFFVLCQFRTLPVSQFWLGYRMLYVYTSEVNESDINTILEKNGCSDVVSSVNQRIPALSSVAPVQAQSESSYLYARNRFFTDKSERAKVFYVPEEQSLELEKSIRELSAFQGTFAGTDGKTSFPWVAPFIFIVFFLMLLFFSKKKLLYASGGFFFLVFVLCRPLYTVSSASCLYVFALFLFHRFWLRKNFLKTALNSPYIFLLAIAPFPLLLISSPSLALFYGLSLLGSFSMLRLYYLFEESQESEYSFRPVYIRSARMIPAVGHLGIRLMGFLVTFLLLIFVARSFFSSHSSLSESSSLPSLPAPVARSSSELVGFKDFVDWSWNTVTFPFRKIGSSFDSHPQEGETVSVTDYVEKDGKMMSVVTPLYVFNSEFRENIYKSVEKLDYPAVEKLLLKQGRNASFGYANGGRASSSERFSIPLLLVMIALPFVLGINYILGRKRYGLSI